MRVHRAAGHLTLLMPVLAAACASSPETRTPRLEQQPAEQRWYASPARCAQGPFDIELPARGAKWGEGLALSVRTARRLQLAAVMLVDGKEVERSAGVYGPEAAGGARPQNQRCVADPRQIADAVAASGPGAPAGTAGEPPRAAASTPGAPAPVAAALVPVAAAADGGRTGAFEVLAHAWLTDGWPPAPPAGARIAIRIWSSVPNDLEGVAFIVTSSVARPDVPEPEYEAFLHFREQRQREEAQRRQADEQRRLEREAQRPQAPAPDPAGAERAEAARADRARQQAEQAERRRLFCDTHPDDRSCWGAGGRRVHEELDRRRTERDAYCAAHGEDARCWTEADRLARARPADGARADLLAEPQGPPPPPRAEEPAPRPSENADWRPGYWHWARGDWFWIAGTWRVPDEDVRLGRTTRAPSPPPPARVEAAPARPAEVHLVWTPGFWQWSGRGWIWVAGSWQLPPGGGVVWRAPTWIPRGAVHVFVPGAWIGGAAP